MGEEPKVSGLSPPSRVPWPPLVLGAGLLIGWGLDAALGSASPPAGLVIPLQAIGVVLILAALAADVWAMATLSRARTTILPTKGADALVTDGPFRYSRNPIYVANAALLVGIGLVLANWWLLLLAPIALILTDRLAVRPEERHLAARFGEAFAAYCRRTRRFL